MSMFVRQAAAYARIGTMSHVEFETAVLMDRFGGVPGLRLRQVAASVVLATVWVVAHAGDARVVYYDVAGNSASKLRSAMDRDGPLDPTGKRFDGRTTWQLTWNFRYGPNGDQCKIKRMSTSLDATIVLPRWVHDGRVSASLARKWDSYLAALRRHEDGHYAHGLAAQKEIEALGQSFHVAGACSAIAKAFNDEASSIIARYQGLDAKYDLDTDHGKSQGATFP